MVTLGSHSLSLGFLFVLRLKLAINHASETLVANGVDSAS
jgi:hypothetical protein